MLPFGLRQSAPKIFNAVADALAWHLHQAGIRHYLDDFIIVAPWARPSAESHWPRWTTNAKRWESLLQTTSETALPPALRTWGLKSIRPQAS